ncbi:MAG TPA: plastocyanin/azurin family copper-binding protein [Solirubrobacterales bacterium]|nr:plastocyanin/azurin family copper-binding protein [Solirubrobacterales bacterium]
MLSRSPRNSLVAALLAGATALTAAGCGTEDPPDLARGKELFTQRCGACHILQNANTKGVQGPNLDLAFKQSVADGLGRSTIAGVVENQIDLPMGNQMPADIYEGQDARDVSEYVASAIGKPAEGGAAGPSGTAEANARNVVEIPADPGGQLLFQAKSATAKAGEVTLASKNDSTVPHNIAIKGEGEGPVVQGGKTSEVSADLKAGRYEFYCSVPGHEQAGMKGSLTVR